MWSCLLILVALFPLRTDAEGSASLFPSSGVCNSIYLSGSCRANIEWRSDAYGPVAASVQRRTLFYVFANQGEVLFMGSTARNAPGPGADLSDILVYEPGRISGPKGSETIPSTADLSCRTSQPSAGRIASRAEELAGPTVVGGPSGYNPCVYTAPRTGVYNVIMYGPAGDGNQTNGMVSADIALGSGLDKSQGSTIAGWDISVRASLTSTTPMNGRVFTYAIAAFTGTNDRPVYMTYYVVILDGYRYKVETHGMDPNGWMMYGNQLGFTQPDGTPLYHNVRGNNGQLTVLQGGVKFALPQYPLFFSPADDATLIALNIPTSPTIAVISGLSFSGTASGNTALYKLGGTFSFESNVDAVYEIILSVGTDFDPNLPGNRVLRGHTPPGPFSVVWDGKDNSGNFFPVGGYQVKASIHGGEYHFPFIDVENNVLGGPFITLLNGPCPNFNGGCTGAFYDDRGYRTTNGQVIGVVNGNLCPSQPGSSSDPVLGFDTTSGNRAFGDRTGNANVDCQGSFGDAKGLDLWTYTPSLTVDTPVYVIDHGISGVVFSDRDNDGAQGANEYGLVGYVVEITNPNGEVWSTVTDATGQYGIHLPIGVGYTVTVIDSLNGVLTTVNPQGPFDVVASTVEVAAPVGFFYQGTLSPTVAGPPVIAGSPPSTSITNQPYYYQFSYTQGGPAPHFAFTNVPSWMTVNTITGEVSGIPNAIATYTIGVTAFNVYGSSSLTYTLVVDGFAPTISGSPSLTGTFGTPYTASFAIDGFPYPHVEVFGPSWMSISPTGEVWGTPDALSSSLVEIRASNSYGNASHFYRLDVVGSGGGVNGNPPPAVFNVPYSYQLMVAGYPAPNLTLVGPAWLNISSTGLISGTPNAIGTFSVEVTAANNLGTSQQIFSLVVNGVAPQITSSPDTYSGVNQQYTYYVSSTGVPSPTYSLIGPSWASIDPATGFLSGTPTQMGVYSFTVTATNEFGSDSVQYTLTIGTPSPTAGPPSAPTPVPLAAPQFTSTPVSTATIGSLYSYVVTATGNPVPTFTIVSGPAWLSLNGNTIQGTPQSSDDGSIVMIIRADNGISPYALQTYRLDVANIAPTPAHAPIITSTPPTNIQIGQPFSYVITYTGQDPVFILAGSLPDWLNLQGCCTLVGTPTQLGLTSSIVLTASNGYQPNNVQSFQLNVVPATTIAPSGAPSRPPTPLPTAVTAPVFTSMPVTSATINTPYIYYITASGYPTSVITTSDLPPWLHFNGQVLSGTPTAGTAGSVVIAVKASNGVNPNATQVFTLNVQNPPTPSTIVSTAPTSAAVGSLYNYHVLTTGSPVPNLTFTGPSFLTLAMNGGVLSLIGSPSAPGNYSVTLTASNGVGSPSVQTYTLVVSAATAAPTQAPTAVMAAPVITSLPGNLATSAGPYTYNITSTGSPVPQYSLVGAPTWLTISGSTLSGTPPSSLTGTISFRVVAANGVSPASSQLVTIQVNPKTYTAPAITSTPPTSVLTGDLYSYVVSATGFPSPVYLWTLPDWLTMSSNNVITGRPPFPGTYTISVRASNGLSPDAVQSYTITVAPTTFAPTPVGTAPTSPVNANAPQITSTPPTTALTGMSFVYNVTMTGNPVPVLSVNGLPSWLSQIGCCTISGTVPSVITGSFIIGLTATNGVNPPATQTAQILFADPPAPRITSIPLTSAQATQPYKYVITTTGSPAPTLTSDPLPSWLTLVNGTLQGTPPVGTTGTVVVSVTASNGVGAAQQNFTISVLNSNIPPVITSSPVVTGTAGSPYLYVITATGNPAPNFTVSGAPSWLQVVGNQLSGTPTGSGSYPITVVATNGVGSSATQSFTVTVLVPPAIGPGSVSPQNVPSGTVYNVQYPVTGNPVPTLSLSNNPSWLSLTDNVVSGIVPESALGETVCYTLTAKSAAGTTSQLKCFDVIPASMETCQNGLQRLRGEMDYVARVSTATCPNALLNESFVNACHQGCDAPVVIVTDLILNNGFVGRRLLAALNSTNEQAIALAAAKTWGLPASNVYTLSSEAINSSYTRVRVLAVTPSNNYALAPLSSADGYTVAQSSSSSAAQSDMLDLLAVLMKSSQSGSLTTNNRIVYVDADTPWWVYFLLAILIISFVCWVLFCCGLLRSREKARTKSVDETPSAKADGREGAYLELDDQEKSAERIRLQRQLQELLAQKRRTLAEITALQAEMQREQDNRLADHDQLEQEKEVSRLLKQMVELEATQQKQHASQIAELQSEITSLKRSVGEQRSGTDPDSSAVQDQIRELGSAYQDLKREQELQKQMQIKEQKKLLDTVENLSRALEKSRSEGEGLRERLDRERREREDLEHAIALDRARADRERAERARERDSERDRLDRSERERLESERARLQAERELAALREKQRQPAPPVLNNFHFSDDSGLDDESGGSGDESQALRFPRGPGLDEDDIDMAKFATMSHADKGVFEQWKAREAHAQAVKAKEKRKAARQLARRQARHIARREAKAARAAAAGVQ